MAAPSITGGISTVLVSLVTALMLGIGTVILAHDRAITALDARMGEYERNLSLARARQEKMDDKLDTIIEEIRREQSYPRN